MNLKPIQSPIVTKDKQAPTSITDKRRADNLKLLESSRELEAAFLSQLVKAMEKTVPKNSLTGSDNNLATMMFATTMAKSISGDGTTGLSKMIYESLKRNNSLPDLGKVNSKSIAIQSLEYQIDFFKEMK